MARQTIVQPASKPAIQSPAPSVPAPAEPGTPATGNSDAVATDAAMAALVAERDQLKVQVIDLSAERDRLLEGCADHRDHIASLDAELNDLRRAVSNAAAAAAAEAIAEHDAGKVASAMSNWQREIPLTDEEAALASRLGVDTASVFAVNVAAGTVVTSDGRKHRVADEQRAGDGE